MKNVSVQHVVLTLAEWDLENVTSEPLHHSLSYMFLFLHWAICTLHYILPLNAQTISSFLTESKEPHLFLFS